jgi:DNA topoisomerase-1
MPGHNWRGVVHNQNATWLAYWNDNINGHFKYVFLSASSKFKGESDIAKYDKARRLGEKIEHIRRSYTKDLTSSSVMMRQMATAMYLIDRLALRVGNEKNTEEEADTVGCCSLKVEHVSFPEETRVHFDFLGKDSIR